MLTREEVDRRLTLDPEGFIPPITPGEKSALKTARDLYAENERLVKFNQDTVSKIAEGRLDGYRELGQRAADAETKCDALKRRVGELKTVLFALASLEGEHWFCPICDCVMDDTCQPVHKAECPVGMAVTALSQPEGDE